MMLNKKNIQDILLPILGGDIELNSHLQKKVTEIDYVTIFGHRKGSTK